MQRSPAATFAEPPAPASATGASPTAAFPPPGPISFPMTPNPASVQLRLAADSTTATITPAGGSVQATAADGTRFTLVVPADALIQAEAVTLTPVDAVDGLPAGSVANAVRLAPEGLLLWKPATLSIQPPAGLSIDEAVVLSGHGDGTEIHQVAMDAANGTVTFSLSHFSVEMIIPGPPNEPGGWPDSIVPTDPWDQVADILGELLRQSHEEPDRADEIKQEMEDVLAAFFDQIIEPQFAAAESSCKLAEEFYPKALTWSRTIDTLDMPDLQPRALRLKQSSTVALNNCLDELGVSCLNSAEEELSEKVVGLTRQLQVLGVERPLPPPCLSCASLASIRAWTGTVTFELEASGEGAPTRNHYVKATVAHSGQLVLTLDQQDPNDQTETSSGWDGTVGGSISVNDVLVRTAPSPSVRDGVETTTVSLNASGPLERVSQFHLRVDRKACTYTMELDGLIARTAVRVINDAGKTTRFEEDKNTASTCGCSTSRSRNPPAHLFSRAMPR